MLRDPDQAELPPDVEALASDVLLGPAEQVDDRFEQLCRAHEPLRSALLRLRVDYERAARAFAAPVGAGAASGGSAASDSAPLPPTIGPYRVLRQIGAGAFGVVFLAQQERPIRREVAIKVLHPSASSPSTVARFLVERETLARMSHPAIARILDAGVDGGRPYFVMEYVPGMPLHRFVATRGAGLTQRLELFLAACDGVNHAHQRGVIHRDLKPHNILVAEVDGQWLPKVIDFGLAKIVEAEATDAVQTHAGAVLGTPAYMSPEQVRGDARDVDTRTDVYALGVILYELLTGVLPIGPEQYPGRKLVELRNLLLESEPPAASVRAAEQGMAYARQMRGELDWILRRAMAKHEADRYASVAEFAADVRRYLADEPVVAGPPSTIYRLTKFVRRHQVLVVAGAIVLLSLVVGFVVSAALYQRAVGNEQRARDHLADFWRLADVIELEELNAAAATLWPSSSERLGEHESWLARAHLLVARRALHAATVATLRQQLAEIPPVDERSESARGARFLVASLDHHVAALDAFTAEHGVLQDVERRTEFARTVYERSIGSRLSAWQRAADAIARSPRYGGFAMRPIEGLVPLGPDPASGLEEFAHLQSGSVPERGADGRLAIGDDTGIVLVLIPGGHVTVGSQADDPQAPHYDPHRQIIELDRLDISGAPFLLGKYELTQGQVLAMGVPLHAMARTGRQNLDARVYSPRHPEESVLVPELVAWLPHFQLRMPSSAEWEVAARAGSGRVFGVGDDVESLQGYANVADASIALEGMPDRRHDDRLHDGFVAHAPVGSFAPNAFGLHDMLGNVAELTFARTQRGDVVYWARGGSFMLPPLDCRIGSARNVMPNQTTPEVGLRVARSVD